MLGYCDFSDIAPQHVDSHLYRSHLSFPLHHAPPEHHTPPVASPIPVDAPGYAAAGPETVLTTSHVTNAISRTYEHLHYPTFIALCAVFAGARSAIYHPMAIALARKQALADYGTLSTATVLRRLVRNEGGIRALSKGMLAMSLANSISEAVYCGAFECLRSELPFAREVSRDLAAGYISDFACRFFYTPLLTVANLQMTQTAPAIAQQRVAAPTHGTNSVLDVACRTYKTSGCGGFFRGFGTTVVVGGAWSAVWWALYAQSKRFLYYHFDSALPNAATGADGEALCASDNFLLNSVASLFTSGSTAVLFNPFLVVRTRLQVVRGSTLRTVFRQVCKESGWRGFFQGTMLSVATCVVDGVLASSSYEYAKYLSDVTKRQSTPLGTDVFHHNHGGSLQN